MSKDNQGVVTRIGTSPVQYSLQSLLCQMVSLTISDKEEDFHGMLHTVFHFGFTFYPAMVDNNATTITIDLRVHFLLKDKELSPHVFLAVDSKDNALTSDIEFKYYPNVESAEEAIHRFAVQAIQKKYKEITGNECTDESGKIDISSWVLTVDVKSCELINETIGFPTSTGKETFFFVQKSMFEADLLVAKKLFENMDLTKEKQVGNSGFYT